MQHPLVIHKPTIEIPITRMDARILLRFERTFLNQLLPHPVVRTEINMFKQLAIQHLVDNTRGLFALNTDHALILCIDDNSHRQKHHP